MTRIAWLGLPLVAAMGLGCTSTTVHATQDTYQQCGTTSDCTYLSDTCLNIVNGSASTYMCTQQCSTDADCPYGGSCGQWDTAGPPSLCYATCVENADCPVGFNCFPGPTYHTGVCLPGNDSVPEYSVYTYGECSMDSDCYYYGGSPSDFCWPVGSTTQGGMCSYTCSTDADCGYPDGVCDNFDGLSSNVCYQTCTTTADCPSPFICSPAGGTTVCLQP